MIVPAAHCLAAGLLAACEAQSLLKSAPPPEIAWLAAVALDEQGEIADATPLESRDSEMRLAPNREGARVKLVGYTREQILPLVLDESLIGGEPLFQDRDCRARLPRAAWAADLGPDDSITPTDPSDLAIGAAWVAGTCPDFDAFYLENQCDTCPVEISRDRCEVGVRYGCNSSELSGTILPDGRVCLRESAKCRATGRRSPDEPSLLCELVDEAPCRLVAHSVPKGGPPESPRLDPGGLVRLALFPSPPAAPSGPWLSLRRSGVVFGMLRAGRKLIVGTTAEPRGTATCSSSDTTLHSIDLDTFSLVESATTTPCARVLVEDPANPSGFMLLSSNRDRVSVARFDERLRLGTIAVETFPGWPQLTVLDASWHDELGLLQALVEGGGLRLILVFDRSLALDSSVQTGYAFGGISGGPGGLMVLSTSDGAAAVDLARRAYEIDAAGSGYPLPRTYGDARVEQLLLFPASRTVAVAMSGPSPRLGLIALDPNLQSKLSADVALVYEAAAEATALGRMVDEQSGLGLLGMMLRVDQSARVAFFNAVERTVRPGTTAIGRGPIGDLVSDGSSVYASLPWTGELVRVPLR